VASDRKYELDELEALIPYRPGLIAEARAQSDAFLQYFRAIYTFNGRSHPATSRVLLAAVRVASFLAMHYKAKFNRPRPSAIRPSLLPPLPVPGHAAYPSGHATQSRLVALCLEALIGPAAQGPAGQPEDGPMRLMARRIARNREVMGLHYPSDSAAGAQLADQAFGLLMQCPTLVQDFPGPPASPPLALPSLPIDNPASWSIPRTAKSLFAAARAEWP
jgi:hypothetical protein